MAQESANNTAVEIEIRVAGEERVLAEWVEMQPGWTWKSELKGGGVAAFERSGPEALAAELAQMVRDGVPVCEFKPYRKRLEEVFVDVLRSGVQATPPPLPKQNI